MITHSQCRFAPPALLAILVLTTNCGSSDGTSPGFSPHVDASASPDAGPDTAGDTSPTLEASPDGASGLADANDDVPADNSAADALPNVCPAPPDCNVPTPPLGSARGWRNVLSQVTALSGPRRHRGRDLFLLEGQDVWILGKFAYGALDGDIQDEDVDVYLLRDCGSGTPWESLGTYRTTKDGDHPTVEGVEDTGGRVFVNFADTGAEPLGKGRHRFLMVLAGDLSTTDQYVEVLPPETEIVVTDIDGTLTTSEYASATDVVGLPISEAHEGSPEMMRAFAQRGYHIFYLTARPEWMMPITREFLAKREFPEGVVHTTLTGLGATGGAATDYKTVELGDLGTRTGVIPSYAFGNKDSDVQAYGNAGIDPSRCYYYDLGSDPKGGTDHGDYAALISMASSAPLACE
jgi:hypothetical protein